MRVVCLKSILRLKFANLAPKQRHLMAKLKLLYAMGGIHRTCFSKHLIWQVHVTVKMFLKIASVSAVAVLNENRHDSLNS